MPLHQQSVSQIPRPFRERIKVRVIISRARGAHVACAIPRSASESLAKKEFQTICGRTLTASRCALGRLSRSGRGVKTAESFRPAETGRTVYATATISCERLRARYGALDS